MRVIGPLLYNRPVKRFLQYFLKFRPAGPGAAGGTVAPKSADIGGEMRLGPALAEINITPFVDVVLVLLVTDEGRDYPLISAVLAGMDGVPVFFVEGGRRGLEQHARLARAMASGKAPYDAKAFQVRADRVAFMATVTPDVFPAVSKSGAPTKAGGRQAPRRHTTRTPAPRHDPRGKPQ